MVACTSSRITTDRDAIRCWAEERGAKPVLIARGSDGDPGTVRLEFAESRDNSSRDIGWEEWFEKFDRSKLALLYQEQTANGERSSFYQMVHRKKADEVENAVGGRGRSAARRGSPRGAKSAKRVAAASQDSSRADEQSPAMAAPKDAKETWRARKTGTTRRIGKKNSPRAPGPSPDSQPLPVTMERIPVMEPETHVDAMRMRSDEDPPIPIPPGEEPPAPVKEPPDTPVIAPDSPVREPGPAEPRRL